GPDRVGLGGGDDVVAEGLVHQGGLAAGAEARHHAALGDAAEGDRADGVHGDDRDGPAALAEVAGAAHEGAGGARPDEQNLQVGELPVDGGGGPTVVGEPVVTVGVLVQPHVPVAARAQFADGRYAAPGEAAAGVLL